jgi:hypothetical protein
MDADIQLSDSQVTVTGDTVTVQAHGLQVVITGDGVSMEFVGLPATPEAPQRSE